MGIKWPIWLNKLYLYVHTYKFTKRKRKVNKVYRSCKILSGDLLWLMSVDKLDQ